MTNIFYSSKAVREALTKGVRADVMRKFGDPIPEPDPSWSEEMKEAHRALHSGLQGTVKFRRYPPT